MLSQKNLAIWTPFLTTFGLFILTPWQESSFLTRDICLALNLASWMLIWWIFAVLPLGVTALLPLVYLPILGLFPIKEVAPSYSNPVIFLFLGGFMIARALEKTGLDRRMALNLLKISGRNDRGILFGFLLATTLLSMWISNTASTLMMVPIALSVLSFLEQNLKKEDQKALLPFSTALLLAIAYSANIGGIITPVGTPPNVVFMGYLNDLFERNIDFYQWMVVVSPIAFLLLAAMFFILCWMFPFRFELPKDFRQFLQTELANQGALNLKQKWTIGLFLMTAGLWILKGPIHWLCGFSFLNDTSIALLGGTSLFLVSNSNSNSNSNSKKLETILDLEDIGKLPWDIFLLFGGGMALATSLQKLGLIQLTTDFMTTLPIESPFLLGLVLAGLTLFLTEIMSNVALCVVILPVLMKFGETQGYDPILFALPAALCSSFAFSMPISTPPNAIVFGTQRVQVSDMLKVGLLLNLIALFIVMGLGFPLIQMFLTQNS